MDSRTPAEIERATDIYMQLQYLGLESLANLKASVDAEIERKKELAREGR